jgi:hypothetical protein
MTVRVSWLSYWKPKDAWYYADPETRKARLAAWREIWTEAEESGAVHLSTSSIRANSPWARVSVWEFPTLDDLLRMVTQLEEAGYAEYLEIDNVVGEPDDDPFAPYIDAAHYTATVA